MAGEVQGRHPVAVVGEKSGLQLPDGTVHPRAVDEYDTGVVAVVTEATVGVADGAAVVDQLHAAPSIAARP